MNIKIIAVQLFVMMCLVTQARDKININMGWKFIRENITGAEKPDFDDSKWQTVDLPHDAAVHGVFRKNGNGASSRVGYLEQKRGWYRRHVQYNRKWQGQRVVIEFEGVYRDAKVYINGQLCDGRFPNGYLDFQLDITDKLHEGDNVVAVNYNNSYVKSSRWYNGEGINRDVWIHVLEPVHVDRYGTYITTPKISEERALVAVETVVRNEYCDSVLCRLVTEIVDPQGRVVAVRKAAAPFAAGEVFTFRQDINVSSPQLWNVGDGRLYKAVSHVFAEKYPQVSSNTDTVSADVYETSFGIRDIEMSPDHGLLVNGKRVYINGVCLHADLGPLGTAAHKAAWDRRLEAVTRGLGCNGIRLSHNAYPKYVLDWADRHGILIVDEFFDKWEESYYGKGVNMGELHMRDIKTQVQRDRNHPSVFIWSVGNEVYQQIREDFTRKGGVDMLKKLVDYTRQLDPSRKITYSQYPNRYGHYNKRTNPEAFMAADPHQFEYYTDVVSTNYLDCFWDRDHNKYPQLVFMAGEMSVGEFGYDYFNYDHSYPIGHFYWGGTDYIGESFGWPAKGWMRGLIDFTNRTKPVGHSVRSFYWPEPMTQIVTRPRGNTDKPLWWNDLKMTWMPMNEHWNYAVGDTVDVQVMSNCDETELFLNGRSLGRRQLPPKDKAPYLVWEVPYAAGELKAVGYNGGQKKTESVVRTAGKPARIIVEADADSLKADGSDLVYLNYTIVDRDGNVCPDGICLHFDVSGQGVNAGVANADMLSNELWQSDFRSTYNGRAQLIVRSKTQAGSVKITAKAKGLKAVKTEIPVI